jgi:hypothetical protein
LSFARNASKGDASLQTSVVLQIDDNPAAISPEPGGPPRPNESLEDSGDDQLDAAKEPQEEATETAALPTLAELERAGDWVARTGSDGRAAA